MVVKITVPLKGSWKAGTTRTYKLSEKNSSWTYTITATGPNAVAYNGYTRLIIRLRATAR